MMSIKKRNTIQGQLVLNAVRQLSNHPTADDVYNHVEKLYPNISKATVYRNLNSLVEDGLLIKISVPDSADRFDHTLERHYHIKCMVCKEFMDLNLDYMQNLDEKVSELTKYKILSHDVAFKGICEKCVIKAQ
jgi:Fur family peroxide stress response transcriptional regulator